MIFKESALPGAYLILVEPQEDERGFFGRSFCGREFAARGLASSFVQCNISFNVRRGTLRGMHFQKNPKPEPKVVRCTRGALVDVVLDLRRDSPTFGKWQAFELTEENREAVYVPPGFAHGFQTLQDNTEVFYQMGEYYVPELAGGIRWNDSAFKIQWPILPPIVSARDMAYPDVVAGRQGSDD